MSAKKGNSYRKKHSDREWREIAKKFNYDSEYDMIFDLYWNQGKSLKDMGDFLGCSFMNVKYRMEHLGIRRRSRGGPNFKGWSN